jgi:Predicted nucleotide-binding protein containing TIR-like domain
VIVKKGKVAHGKKRVPLDQLVKILNKYKIPYIVATEEPHKGRPIGVKVSEEMKKCSAGIFIFTGEEELKDSKENVIIKPILGLNSGRN